MPAAVAQTDPVVRLTGVHLIRDGVPILRGLNWEVRKGEHWAVLGANGCGKTTLMRIISGRMHPTRGAVEVLGRRFGSCDMAGVWRRVGWVSSALHAMLRPRLQALGIVLTGRTAGLALFEEPSREDKDAAMTQLKAAGCPHLAYHPFALLSQGEQMRVMIARALFGDPEILVLDEPCVGLDPPARERLLEYLDRISRAPGGPTLLYVTHHIEEIIPSISHVLMIADGRAAASGPKEAVLTAANLERAFGCPFRLERDGTRYRAHVLSAGRSAAGASGSDVPRAGRS